MYTKALLTDLYQLTMMQGLFFEGKHEQQCVFDRYYRTNPFQGGYTVVAGLEHLIDYVHNIHFSEDDLAYLKSTGFFQDEFLEYLKDLRFTGDIYAMPEGTVAFPQEVLLRVQTKKDEALLLETCMSMIMNHESLIATKARRVRTVAGKDNLMEFGLRRAQGKSAGVYGARSAMIGGFNGTSNVLAGAKFGMPVLGTMAHSWIEAFDSEYDAFRAWADIYPDNCSLLADTYDVLESGVPNAIRIFNELKAEGHSNFGIRIDSGDVTKLAEAARKMMDETGFPNARITISNALDENIIQSLLEQGAPIDNFGVGEKMITSSSSPVLSGVYKLSAVIRDGQLIPKIKVSESKGKLTLPGIKQTYRLIDNKSGKAFADIIALRDEELPSELTAFKADPLATKLKGHLSNFTAVPLQKEAMDGTEVKTDLPGVFDIQKFSREQLALLPHSTKRLLNSDEYPVFVTPKLYNLQQELVAKFAE